MTDRFNIRVYGIWLDKGRILSCEETVRGRELVKFPGGGLEFGEGIVACLKREFKEELGLEIETFSHFYTTENFIPSAFRPKDQIISIYHKVIPEKSVKSLAYVNGSVFKSIDEPDLLFRWLPISETLEKTLTLPIDKEVARLLYAESVDAE